MTTGTFTVLAKINFAKCFCNTKVAGLGEVFLPWSFSASYMEWHCICIIIDRYVYDTRNEYMKDLSEILYFDPYMRLGSEILYILFDKRRNTEELHEDFLFDFSQDCAEDADKFAEILLEDQHNIR